MLDRGHRPKCAQKVRNSEWFHMDNDDIISMPDKWEYPWYAAWDLAFHMLAFQAVDSDFAKSQLDLILRNDYLHPNGQMPAYEWNFGDVNPPVHAYATMQIYLTDKERNNGKGDLQFLVYAFSKLLVNFTWWLNRKDRSGNNVFEGGFLGLDNIGVFDRSAPLPTAGIWSRLTGPRGWCSSASRCCVSRWNWRCTYPTFEEFVVKFFEHTMWIAGAMDRMGEGQDQMWDEEDGFFYDVLRLPDGQAFRLKVRSMVGLLPLAAVAIFEEGTLEKLPTARKRMPGVYGAPSRTRGEPSHAGHAGSGGKTIAGHRERGEAAPHPRENARRERVLRAAWYPRAVALSPRSSLCFRPRRPGVSRFLSAGRLGQRNVRRELQLEGTGLDAGELPALYRPSAARRLLRRYVQGGMPDRLGETADFVRGRARAGRAPNRNICPGRLGAPAGVWRRGEIPDRPALARQHPFLRILPWR